MEPKSRYARFWLVVYKRRYINTLFFLSFLTTHTQLTELLEDIALHQYVNGYDINVFVLKQTCDVRILFTGDHLTCPAACIGCGP